MKRHLPFIFVLLIIGCSESSEKSEIKKVTYHDKLERIQTVSDSTYDRFSKDSTIRYETYRLDSTSIAFASHRSDTLLAIVFRTNGIDTSVAEYYPNGQIKGDVNFLHNGRIDGPATYYHSDGRVSTRGQFRYGKRWGEWKKYDSQGNLIEIVYYDQKGKFERKEKIKN